MTSVNYNVSANTALRTLQQTNKSLEASQNRLSTGLAIGEAKDNAAYWSISTTLKSDNKALSTVKDALGLGAATVDVAYQGLNKSLEVLNEMKSKLTAATQDGVDREAVQAELAQLQKQLAAIGAASSFSGENWLQIDSSTSGFSPDKSVVSSFTRDASGSVSIETIKISTTGLALFNSDKTEATRGILDTSAALSANGNVLNYGGNTLGNLNKGGLASVAAENGLEPSAKTASAATGSYVFNNAADQITFTIAVDGKTAVTGVAIDLATVKTALGLPGGATTATVNSAADMAKVVQQALTNKGVTGVTVGVDGNNLTYTSDKADGTGDVIVTAAATADDYSVGVDGLPGGGDDSGDKVIATFLNTVFNTPGRAPIKASATMEAFTGSMSLDANDTVSFQINYDGANVRNVKIDKDLVNLTLSKTDGSINGSDDFAKVITAALASGTYTTDLAGTGASVADTVVKVSSVGGKIVFQSQDPTLASAIKISDVKADAGSDATGSTQNRISVADIDISAATLAARGVSNDKIKTAITAYINVVSSAINQVTSAAANLGAVGSRIELQQSFVDTLMDTIDKGVSGLIDADLSEESTRLQALQTKQQLGVQALSIANQSTQQILRLFQ